MAGRPCAGVAVDAEKQLRPPDCSDYALSDLSNHMVCAGHHSSGISHTNDKAGVVTRHLKRKSVAMDRSFEVENRLWRSFLRERAAEGSL